jgi:hypothetical protein
MIAIAVECRVRVCWWTEQRQAVSIRDQTATRRPEGEIGSAGQGDAERLPVQAPIQKAEVCRVNVDEDAAGLEHGQVKGQVFDACRGKFQFTGCLSDTPVDGTKSIGSLRADVVEDERCVRRKGSAHDGRSQIALMNPVGMRSSQHVGEAIVVVDMMWTSRGREKVDANAAGSRGGPVRPLREPRVSPSRRGRHRQFGWRDRPGP